MHTSELLKHIYDINLSYLLLAQRLIVQDKASAMFRLGINEEMVCDIPDLRRVLHSYLVLHNRNHEPLLPNAPAFMLGVDQGTSLYFICIKYIGRIPNNQHIGSTNGLAAILLVPSSKYPA